VIKFKSVRKRVHEGGLGVDMCHLRKEEKEASGQGRRLRFQQMGLETEKRDQQKDCSKCLGPFKVSLEKHR